MGTFEAVLRDVSPQAIIEAAQRFVSGLVPGQSATFAPSIAEFAQEARRIDEVLPLRGRPKLTYTKPAPVHQTQKDRIRMSFKLSVLSEGLRLRQVDRVAEANKAGMDEMMALAQDWGVSIPEELWRSA